MSYDEYLEWAGSDVRAEWKDGEVIVFMPVKKYHQRVVQFLHVVLEHFVTALRLGAVGVAPIEVRLSPQGPSREPDLFFVGNDSLPRWTDTRLEGGPDLAVEVISDDSVGRDRGDKFYEYQEAGVSEYWIIDPRPGKERADFYALDADGRYQPVLADADGVFHSRVLAGFALPLAWLWQDPPPSALQAIVAISRGHPELSAALGSLLGERPA
ncbi:MAG: N-acetylmuramoyl-L-alanine amidase [uncultured Chloroflexia bacterium]|uniref:N-acetylmuramoyl-L-alanine amidase n=1 Tax=uncultured Chloroflexia bacterium TaxID=1672391 RepID=A0A6J4HNF0_9CHLR|nr:MAG: N-acetylmuramoyl-L-alanine amidase [uncultured Chloroflexia bacterium]